LHLCAKSVPRRKAFSSYQFFEPCWIARDVAVSVLLVLLVLQMLLMLLLQMLLLLQLVLVLQVVLVLLVLLELVLLVLMQLLLMLQSLNLEGVALLLKDGRTQVAQGQGRGTAQAWARQAAERLRHGWSSSPRCRWVRWKRSQLSPWRSSHQSPRDWPLQPLCVHDQHLQG
jgi:hypothetical protein